MLFLIAILLTIVILFPVFAQAKLTAKMETPLDPATQAEWDSAWQDEWDSIWEKAEAALDREPWLEPLEEEDDWEDYCSFKEQEFEYITKGKVEKRFGMSRERNDRSRSHSRAKTAKRRSWMKTA